MIPKENFVSEFSTEEKILEDLKFIKQFLTDLTPWKEEVIRIVVEKKAAEEAYHARKRSDLENDI